MRALALAPENPQTKFNLAIVEKRLGRVDSAREIYSELARSAPPGLLGVHLNLPAAVPPSAYHESPTASLARAMPA